MGPTLEITILEGFFREFWDSTFRVSKGVIGLGNGMTHPLQTDFLAFLDDLSTSIGCGTTRSKRDSLSPSSILKTESSPLLL